MASIPKITRTFFESLSRAELIQEFEIIYNQCEAVREYYHARLTQDGQRELLEKYKTLVTNEFFPRRGMGKLRLGEARKAISTFRKLSSNTIDSADIMLHFVEQGVRFTKEYGDIYESFYTSMENMYEQAARFVIGEGFTELFISRFQKIVHDTKDFGWGFYDTLGDIYVTNFSSTPSMEG